MYDFALIILKKCKEFYAKHIDKRITYDYLEDLIMTNRVLVIILIFLMTTLTSIQVFADQIDDATSKKRSIQSQINSIDTKKKNEKDNLENTKAEKEKLLNQITQNSEDYKSLIEEVNKLEEEIEGAQNSIAEAEKRYNEQRETFKKRLRVLYKNSKVNFLETLVNSRDINDFLKRLKVITLIGQKDNELIRSIAVAKEEMEFIKATKEDEQDKVKKEAQEKKVAIDTLNVSRAQVEERISNSYSKLKWYEEQEDKLIKQSEEISNLIKNLQSSSGKYAGGTMTWPVPSSYSVSSYFGNRIHPIFKTWKFHSGIDIGASRGKSIVAANSGTIIFAGWQSGYGNTLIVDHGGGITTLYAHSSKTLVKLGDKVKAGQEIAKIGSTGWATGPHLHFEVRVNGKATDPLKGYLSSK